MTQIRLTQASQIDTARAAREQLSANKLWDAIPILEGLAAELSRGEFRNRTEAERELMKKELEGLQTLALQGSAMYGKWLDRITPAGAYTSHGRYAVPSTGGQLTDLTI